MFEQKGLFIGSGKKVTSVTVKLTLKQKQELLRMAKSQCKTISEFILLLIQREFDDEFTKSLEHFFDDDFPEDKNNGTIAP